MVNYITDQLKQEKLVKYKTIQIREQNISKTIGEVTRKYKANCVIDPTVKWIYKWTTDASSEEGDKWL